MIQKSMRYVLIQRGQLPNLSHLILKNLIEMIGEFVNKSDESHEMVFKHPIKMLFGVQCPCWVVITGQNVIRAKIIRFQIDIYQTCEQYALFIFLNYVILDSKE